MEKKYIKPEIQVIEIELQPMMAASEVGVYSDEENIEDILADMNIGGNTGGNTGDDFVHIGSDLPPNKQYLWIDTSPKDNKISSKYIEMLDLTTEKLSNLNTKIITIEENIDRKSVV